MIAAQYDETSFRNMIWFYRDILDHVRNYGHFPDSVTKGSRKQLRKRGVTIRVRWGNRLSPSALSVLTEIKKDG